MSRKTPVRDSNRSRDEKSRQRVSKKQLYAYSENKRSYIDDERNDQQIVRPRRRSATRSSRADFYEEPRGFDYQEPPRQRTHPNRLVRDRRIRDEAWQRKRYPKEKNPGIMVFSFLSTLVFYGLTIGIVMMAVMFSFSSKSTASIFGYRFYTVLTNSMAPQENGQKGGFYAGDIIIVKLMDGNKIKKNDIVTFAVGDGSRYLTHRMVERKDELNGEKGNYLVTKGDANKTNDPPITADRVLGKVVFYIPKIGDLLEFVREEFWACFVCILSVYGFFLVLKSYLFPTKEESIGKRKNVRSPMYGR